MWSVCHTVDRNPPKLAFEVEQTRIGRPGQLTSSRARETHVHRIISHASQPRQAIRVNAASTLGLQPTRHAPRHAYMDTFVRELRGRHSYSGYTTHLIRISLRG